MSRGPGRMQRAALELTAAGERVDSWTVAARATGREPSESDLASARRALRALARSCGKCSVRPAHLAAVPDVTDDERNSATAERWRCPDCGWRQAIGSVELCEICGWPHSRGEAS
jgi:hypothetical protein